MRRILGSNSSVDSKKRPSPGDESDEEDEEDGADTSDDESEDET